MELIIISLHQEKGNMALLRYLIFAALFYFISCGKEPVVDGQKAYPAEIVENNIEEEFNIARWELYKLYEKCAYHILKKDLIIIDDTIPHPVELSLKYGGISDLKNDTFFIPFFFERSDEEHWFQKKCEAYNAIGFIKGDSTPQFIYLGDLGYIDYVTIEDTGFNDHLRDVLSQRKVTLNDWVKKEAKKRKLLHPR